MYTDILLILSFTYNVYSVLCIQGVLMHWNIWNMCKEFKLKPVQTNTHTHMYNLETISNLQETRILTTSPFDFTGCSRSTSSSIPCEAATVPCNTCSPPLPVGKQPSPGSNDGLGMSLSDKCEITIDCFIDLYENLGYAAYEWHEETAVSLRNSNQSGF